MLLKNLYSIVFNLKDHYQQHMFQYRDIGLLF
jgi:hypothetical protein